jgi:Tfp pilus assembly protein PilN
MTQVNLLPSEIRQRQRSRRTTALVALAGAVVVGFVLFLYVLQGLQLSKVNDDLDAQEQTNARLQAQVNDLQRFAEITSTLQERKKLLEQTLAGTVPWSGVLHDLSLVTPDKMWLTSMTGDLTQSSGATAPPPGTTGTVAPQLVGSIQFAGDALDSKTVALWLTKLEEVDGWVNAWLSQAQKTTINTTDVFSFDSSVDLSKAAAKGGSR